MNRNKNKNNEEDHHLGENDSSSTSAVPILFMKVDCEGADPTILVSSEQLFSSHRVQLLVFELHKNERGFPKKFNHVVEMLIRNQYEVYLLGRCHHPESNNKRVIPKDSVGVPLRSLMLLKFNDGKSAARWKPILEGAIAISPQLQEIMKNHHHDHDDNNNNNNNNNNNRKTTTTSSSSSRISEYFGGGLFAENQKCGLDFEFIPYF